MRDPRRLALSVAAAAALGAWWWARRRRRAERPPRLTRWVTTMPPNPFGPLVPLMSSPASNKILAQGTPPADAFPLRAVAVTLADGTELALDAARTHGAQRYAQFAKAPLVAWLRAHVARAHAPPAALDWDVSVAAGAMSALSLACAMLVERGDVVLCERHTFTAGRDLFIAAGARLVGVATDADGLVPGALAAALRALDRATDRARRVLYTIPVGQNPTGARLAPDRYAAIYALCVEHGVTIVEDDAYFYQQYDLADGAPDGGARGARKDALGPSFLSLDAAGIVLRIDTFSKALCPGFRLGWVTGSRELVAAYDSLAFVSSQHGSSLALAVLGRVLEHWGDDGFDRQARALQAGLAARCRALLAALDTHRVRELASWAPPRAGMFLFLRLRGDVAGLERARGAALVAAMAAHRVAVLDGDVCAVGGDASSEPACLRLSFALPEGEYDEAIRRLRALLLSFRDA